MKSELLNCILSWIVLYYLKQPQGFLPMLKFSSSGKGKSEQTNLSLGTARDKSKAVFWHHPKDRACLMHGLHQELTI